MKTHTEGCMICAKPLIYFEQNKTVSCYLCKQEYSTNVTCEDGHYICDDCHAEKGLIVITKEAMVTESKDPLEIASKMMRYEEVNMHGPEHHYLIVASLLAAYKNAGGDVDLEKSLGIARQRAKGVPGGICGMWGACGAAIGSGIFISIITSATPLSNEEWSLANRMTSESLALIAEHGGPRCCKRNTYLAALRAIAFVKKQFGISMDSPKEVTCDFYERNKQCRREKCLFYKCKDRK